MHGKVRVTRHKKGLFQALFRIVSRFIIADYPAASLV
jgi:hypothetical protein